MVVVEPRPLRAEAARARHGERHPAARSPQEATARQRVARLAVRILPHDRVRLRLNLQRSDRHVRRRPRQRLGNGDVAVHRQAARERAAQLHGRPAPHRDRTCASLGAERIGDGFATVCRDAPLLCQVRLNLPPPDVRHGVGEDEDFAVVLPARVLIRGVLAYLAGSGRRFADDGDDLPTAVEVRRRRIDLLAVQPNRGAGRRGLADGVGERISRTRERTAAEHRHATAQLRAEHHDDSRGIDGLSLHVQPPVPAHVARHRRRIGAVVGPSRLRRAVDAEGHVGHRPPGDGVLRQIRIDVGEHRELVVVVVAAVVEVPCAFRAAHVVPRLDERIVVREEDVAEVISGTIHARRRVVRRALRRGVIRLGRVHPQAHVVRPVGRADGDRAVAAHHRRDGPAVEREVDDGVVRHADLGMAVARRQRHVSSEPSSAGTNT